MKLDGKTVVVTGAASGIGRALAVAFKRKGANLVIADRLTNEIEDCAQDLGVPGLVCDVSKESDIQYLVSSTENSIGPIDLFCSNAGICMGEPDHCASASNDVWQACWDIHVMSHVYAARAVLPSMLQRGDGYFVQMASAAGLLSQIGDAAYSASKHAAVGFAESLSITHADDGIKVSAVCPQYVATPMLGYHSESNTEHAPGVISPEQVAEVVLEGIEAEKFLILPHPEVEKYIQVKTANYDQWVAGMRKLRRKLIEKAGSSLLRDMHKWV